jgi:hypothetical protein
LRRQETASGGSSRGIVVMRWFKKKETKLESVPVTPVPEVLALVVQVPVAEPEKVQPEVPVKPVKHKVSRRITPEDLGPFKLGTLQQSVQVYYYLIEKGFTFADLVEYVHYATEFQKQTILQDYRVTVAKQPVPKESKEESAQRAPLTREERKKFRRRR